MRSKWLFSLGLAVVLLSHSLQAREWSDQSGKFRITAEFVIIRNGKVLLEKADGSIITVSIEKLCQADRDYLKSLSPEKPATPQPASGATSSSTKTSTPAVKISTADLPNKVHAILKANCHRCHGEDGTSEGGFNYVLDLEKLAQSIVSPKQPESSLLLERMMDEGDSAMPPIGEDPRPTETEIATIKAWIAAGAPSPSKASREFISNDQMVQLIAADQAKASQRSQKFLRYFTLTHAYNAGVSEDELQTYRNAFAKLVNSLSWSNDVVMPTAIDRAKTILRVDIRELSWTKELWEAVEEANPYFLACGTPEAQKCYELAETKMPYVRIDWFVNAASRPPLYHTILDIPETAAELEENLHVNAEANIRQEKVLRAGFNRSGVSQNNRLIEWHRSPYGSYWKSYDFGGNTSNQNLFEHPLGPNDVDQPFSHDGGELIFSLPNGFQGYMLVDSKGNRIDKGPTEIVSDPKQADKTVTNGVSCMSCHYTGIIPKADEIHEFVNLNKRAFDNPEDVLALYQGTDALNEVYEADAKRFATAINKIGIKSLSRSGEPVSAMALKFQEELDLTRTAFEFGLKPDELSARLTTSETMLRSFGALRAPGGTIKRDVFATLFGQAAIEFKLTIEASVAFTGGFKPGLVKLKSPADAGLGAIRTFPDLGWGVHSLAFSPNGGILAAGKPDREVLLFDLEKNEKLAGKDDLENLGATEACLFTPDGTKFLAAGEEILIWDVDKTGLKSLQGQFVGHSKTVTCMSISRDGQFVLSGGEEKKIRYWQLKNPRELAVFDGFEGKVKDCRILPNGREALATDGSNLLYIDLKDKKVTKTKKLTGSWASGQSAAISLDGKLVAAGDSYDVRIWEVETGKELPKLDGTEIQWCMTFTPDGTRLLSGGTSKINVWDVKTSQRLSAIPLVSSGYVKSVATSPDNIHISGVSGNAGVTLEVFRLPPVEK